MPKTDVKPEDVFHREELVAWARENGFEHRKSKSIELEPCHFCGENDQVFSRDTSQDEWHNGWTITCKCPYHTIVDAPTKLLAEKKWNEWNKRCRGD